MKTCEEIRMDWKEIRPKLGNLINAMDAKIDETGNYDAAYMRGYDDCTLNNARIYDAGCDAAWDVAQRIILNKDNLDCESRERVFGYRYTPEVIGKLSAPEAIQKIKEYDDKRALELEEAKAARQKIIIEDLKEMYRKYGPDEVFAAQKEIDLAGR